MVMVLRGLRRPRGGRACGVVMMDVLAALALLGAGVFMSVTFFRSEVRELRYTQEKFAAMLIVESEIERLHTLSYEAIEVGAGQALALDLPSARRLKEARGSMSVREIEPGLKEVTVRTTWSSSRGRPLFVEMSCVVSREGLQAAAGAVR